MAFYMSQGRPKLQTKQPLQATLWLFPPHNRSYDVDNRVKPTFDALTKCGLWIDDQYVRKLIVTASVPVERGAVVVEVEPYDEALEREYVAELISRFKLRLLETKRKRNKRSESCDQKTLF